MAGPQVSLEEVSFSAIRAQGAGGQNVNKVSNAVHLRFDIHASSLPEPIKLRLLALPDARITAEGVVVIKAQEYRSLRKTKRMRCCACRPWSMPPLMCPRSANPPARRAARSNAGCRARPCARRSKRAVLGSTIDYRPT